MRNIHLLPLGLAVILFATLSSMVQGQDSAEPPQATRQAAPPALGGDTGGYLATTLRRQAGNRASGAIPVTRFEDRALQTNERWDLEVPVEGGRCYMALATGMPSVRELDLYVIDPFGQQRARDNSRDALPFARFCPTVSGRWKIQLHLFNGYGRVAAQVLQLPEGE